MELSLAFIGWFFTLASAGALALGAALIWMLATAGDLQRRYLSYSIWNDLLLAAIWVLGLAGGIGVIRLQPLGRYLLELFCWALIVLLFLSSASRLYALNRPDPGQPPANWFGAIARVEGAEAVLGAIHQEIDAIGVGHRNELRLGVDFEMIVDVAQALGRLLDTAVEVVDGLLLRTGESREERKRQGGKQIRGEFHGRLLFRDLKAIAHFT